VFYGQPIPNNSVLVSKRKQCVFPTEKSSKFYFSENHTKSINTLCVQNKKSFLILKKLVHIGTPVLSRVRLNSMFL
jgi:hypothetical protein